MTQLARRHELTAVTLIDDEFDAEECRNHMATYCREVVLVPNPNGGRDIAKRLIQLRSLVSTQSFERLRLAAPELQQALDQVLRATQYDIVNLEFPYLGHLNLRQAPPGGKRPPVVVDSHEIAYDLARQFAGTGTTRSRRFYAGANWRKLRREELQTYRERRLLDELPRSRTAVIPNAANVDYYQPRPTDPPPDGRTIVYFGLLSTVPNIDGVIHFVENIWPLIAKAHPEARFKIIGGKPAPALQALAGTRIELTGFVPDLRPHLAEAAVVVVPLRLGGGTRLKIVEAMAMGKAIVSTELGAEGIEATRGREIIIEDQPTAFADAVNRLLAEPDLAKQIGDSARQLAVERYSWAEAAHALEGFYHRILGSVS
jgi:glycosyltransferase involved in cell wall biosynthesis